MYLSKIDIFTNKIKKTNPIDISNWKEFNLIDIFPDYERGKRLKKSDRISGDLPLITAGQFNNGIAQYVKLPKTNKLFENCITIDMFGNCFYQEGKYICDDNIISIKNIKNKWIGLFIVSILNRYIIFDFKKQFRIKHIDSIKIKLPVDKSGEPNWEYMENYVKNITLYKNLNRLIQVYEDIINEKRIDISNWKNIKLIDLFDYKRGKRYKKRDHEKGNIPYISSSAKENGIDNYINPPDYMTIYENCITIANSGSIGTCFYHNYKFVASDHVHVLSLKNITLKKEIAIFLITLIEKNKNKFTFNKEISESTIKEIELFIPFKNNEPDWEYMENYVKEKYKNIESIIK